MGYWFSLDGKRGKAAPIAQLYRAFRIWSMDGGSWREWSTAPLCGL